MEDKRVTAKQILAEIGIDVERMAQKVADAINNAQAGAIIDQSEEQVRDAHAEFRQKTYQKAISLLGKTSRLFPPRKSQPSMIWKNKGKQKTSHLTVNGRLEFSRTVFWNENHGTVVPMDILLGIESSNHSLGVREICCRESLNNAFVPAGENIKRLAQLDISSSVIRQIVEHEGSELSRAQHKSQTGPDFKAEDCTDKTLITGTDGVNLREYIGKRIAMTDYPYFLDLGYDIGSGPTESFCGCLTKRLKGSGMRWDTDNAEAVMALASIYYSNQWDRHWKSRHKAA